MPKQANVISHWHQLIENFQASPLEFYASFDKAVGARSIPEVQSARVEHKEGGLASAKREYLRLRRGKHAFDICAAPFGTGFFVSWWFTEPPLPYAFLYTAGFFFAVAICFMVASSIGYEFGATTSFAASMFLATCFGFFGVPLGLLFLGHAVRSGAIEGESTVLAVPLVGWLYERIFSPDTFYKMDTALMFQDAVHNAVLEVVDCMTANKGVRALTEAERKPVMKRFGSSG